MKQNRWLGNTFVACCRQAFCRHASNASIVTPRCAVSHQTNFEQRKRTFLGKRDKSSAGAIDARAVEVCEELNKRPAFFTTSSCAGRAFLWRGDGVKSTDSFTRWRVSHDLVEEHTEKYFDLAGLEDPNASGAASSSLGKSQRPELSSRQLLDAAESSTGGGPGITWLRFEPFILHVCCRDFTAAAALMAAARTVFKNVGLQGWGKSQLIVAIWGDEGLDMPLAGPAGVPLFCGQEAWLQGLVNSRHMRNWGKIDRFTAALRAMEDPSPEPVPSGGQVGEAYFEDDLDHEIEEANLEDAPAAKRRPGPRHFDVVGDVAVLHSRPQGADLSEVGKAILAQARQVKVVAVKSGALGTELRRPTEAFEIIAGRPRLPLITTHSEFGVKIVVDLGACFFSTRLAGERQRLCNLVRPGEKILVAFAGCCPEVLQLAARPEAAEILAIELNPVAVQCLGSV
ncbi:unnamed protein product [Polarella glacialis]|uniref:tRNA(Phe) 7-[(3-amino-3-carboxypropyl)-4-demethylwyosine(37)-N(4)]-methyltransferase n=1 Tax=Polarella glacialis TaxID=89957 RepID=A0A813J7L2_POLGL|nr:unnamed protein product [Polarella glacialis]